MDSFQLVEVLGVTANSVFFKECLRDSGDANDLIATVVKPEVEKAVRDSQCVF